MINQNSIDSSVNPIITYNDLVINKRHIIKENKDKSGIYRFTNKLNGKMYIGSSSNLSSRFLKHFNLNYISKHKNELSISRAMIKYGYDNFYLEILEFCDVSNLLKREQFYLDLLEPVYNNAKIAGSNLGFKHSKESRAKISKALKGSPLLISLKLGTTHTEETKNLMSISRSGERNPHYGKTHTEVSKDLIRKSRIGKTHSTETRLSLSMLKGTTIYLYEINTENKYVLKDMFNSYRNVAKYIGISQSTVSRDVKSGDTFKGKYKFSSSLLNTESI
jgi:group I intron endonuclease